MIFHKSFLCVIQLKAGALSQFPRPGIKPTAHPNSDKPRLKDIKIMGYSLRSENYRYTTWVKFSNITKKPNWEESIAEEFYDHSIDPNENKNLANKKTYNLKKEIQQKLLLDSLRTTL